MDQVYVGLDLGSSVFQQVTINAVGAIGHDRRFPTNEANLRKAFADLRGEIQVHLEAGELAPWVAAVISPLVQRVVCSHPAANAWIAKDADKCDRIDAFKLAELLRLNRFKEVHYPQQQSRRDFKTLVQHYDELTAADGEDCSLRGKGFQAAPISKAAGFVLPQQFQFVILETINVKKRGTTVARRTTRNVPKHNNSFRAFVACDICYVNVRETEPATVRFHVVFVFAIF